MNNLKIAAKTKVDDSFRIVLLTEMQIDRCQSQLTKI